MTQNQSKQSKKKTTQSPQEVEQRSKEAESKRRKERQESDRGWPAGGQSSCSVVRGTFWNQIPTHQNLCATRGRRGAPSGLRGEGTVIPGGNWAAGTGSVEGAGTSWPCTVASTAHGELRGRDCVSLPRHVQNLRTPGPSAREGADQSAFSTVEASAWELGEQGCHFQSSWGDIVHPSPACRPRGRIHLLKIPLHQADLCGPHWVNLMGRRAKKKPWLRGRGLRQSYTQCG